MEQKEIQDITRAYFKQLGFQVLKKTKFYFDSDELTLRLWLDRSQFSETYYFTYDIRIKALHPEIKDITNENVWDTVGGRLTYSLQKGFHVEYPLWDQQTYLRDLKMLTEKQLVPIMQQGVAYVKKLALDAKSCGAGIVFKEDDRKKILAL